MQAEELNIADYCDQVCCFIRHLSVSIRGPENLAGCMPLLTTAVEQDLRRLGDPSPWTAGIVQSLVWEAGGDLVGGVG